MEYNWDISHINLGYDSYDMSRTHWLRCTLKQSQQWTHPCWFLATIHGNFGNGLLMFIGFIGLYPIQYQGFWLLDSIIFYPLFLHNLRWDAVGKICSPTWWVWTIGDFVQHLIFGGMIQRQEGAPNTRICQCLYMTSPDSPVHSGQGSVDRCLCCSWF